MHIITSGSKWIHYSTFHRLSLSDSHSTRPWNMQVVQRTGNHLRGHVLWATAQRCCDVNAMEGGSGLNVINITFKVGTSINWRMLLIYSQTPCCIISYLISTNIPYNDVHRTPQAVDRIISTYLFIHLLVWALTTFICCQIHRPAVTLSPSLL